MLRNRVRLIGLAIVTGLLFSVLMAPSVIAKEFPGKNKILQTSLMEDKFANDAGGTGFATVKLEQEGSLMAEKVVGKNLLANTDYDVHVVVTDELSGFALPIRGFAVVAVTTNGGGSFNIKDIDTGFVGVVGTKYRIDIIVVKNGFTHTHNGGGPDVTNALLEELAHAADWDVVLACTPAFIVTVVD